MHEKEDSTVACMYLFWRFVAARGQRDQNGSPGRRAEQRATVAAAAQLAEFALRPVLILLQVMTSMKMLCSYFSSFSPPLSPCAPPFTPPPRARSLTQRRSPKTLNTNTPHTLLAVFPFACAMSPQGPRTCVNRVTPPPPPWRLAIDGHQLPVSLNPPPHAVPPRAHTIPQIDTVQVKHHSNNKK